MQQLQVLFISQKIKKHSFSVLQETTAVVMSCDQNWSGQDEKDEKRKFQRQSKVANDNAFLSVNQVRNKILYNCKEVVCMA